MQGVAMSELNSFVCLLATLFSVSGDGDRSRISRATTFLLEAINICSWKDFLQTVFYKGWS